jgi:uncharacterized protein (DUF427 family)
MSPQSTSAEPAPGFVRNPEYSVTVEPVGRRIRVMLGGETLVDTTNALLMRETNHKPVFYFPRADCRMDLMAKTDHDTF